MIWEPEKYFGNVCWICGEKLKFQKEYRLSNYKCTSISKSHKFYYDSLNKIDNSYIFDDKNIQVDEAYSCIGYSNSYESELYIYVFENVLFVDYTKIRKNFFINFNLNDVLKNNIFGKDYILDVISKIEDSLIFL